MTAARRLLLSTTALELLRRQVLPPPLTLPPGFACEPLDDPPPDWERDAERELQRAGALVAGRPHVAVAADLRVLAAPEVAVVVRAARPGLEVTACLAVRGARGAGLLRTDDALVQLSAFRADRLPDELARVVPAPTAHRRREAQDVPLDRLLDGGGPLSGRGPGALRAAVLRPEGLVGSEEWVWDGAGWLALQPLPPQGERAWVRLVPVAPADLAARTASLVARAAA